MGTIGSAFFALLLMVSLALGVAVVANDAAEVNAPPTPVWDYGDWDNQPAPQHTCTECIELGSDRLSGQ